MPLQGPSVQPTKVEPESAFADRVMLVLAGKETGGHRPEQLRLLSVALDMLPLWPASLKTLRPTWTMGAVVLNVAVTFMREFSAIVQVAPAAHPPPPSHPPKVEVELGVAVKVTLGGLAGSVRAYWPVHIPA